MHFKLIGLLGNMHLWPLMHGKVFNVYEMDHLHAVSPIHGPSRPFNFFGYFDTGDMNYLEERLRTYRGSNHTFLLSHYPLSTTVTGVTTSGKSFDDLSRYFSAMLCGHLHLLVGGLGDRLHALHRQGFVELEMGDMKQHGIFRIISIDHDLISFVDRSILNPKTHKPDRAPVVLITNPKDSRYIVPRHEPLGRMGKSSHIRMLIFHALPLKNISVLMDGKKMDIPVIKAEKDNKGGASAPLYVMPWDPSLYMDGRSHKLEVRVMDMAERLGYHTVLFRLDGKPERIGGPGEFIMTSRIAYWSKRLFFLIYAFVTVGMLLVPKLMSSYLQATRRYHRWRVKYSRFLTKLDEPAAIALPENWSRRVAVLLHLRFQLIYRDFVYFCHASVFRLVTLASLPETFYPLYFHALYIVVGPYFIGELVPVSTAKSTLLNPSTHRYGFMYVYGMYIDKHWVPLLDTWVFGLLEVAYILFPLTLYLSFCITPPEQLYAVPAELDKTFDEGNVFFFPPRHERRQFPLHRNTKVRMIVAGAVLYQLVNTFFIGIFYGPVAVLISPGKTWFVLWACYALWRHRWSEKGVWVDLKTESPALKPIPVSEIQPARFTLTEERVQRRNK